MHIVLRLIEMVLGAASLIGWVTVLGLIFSKIGPEKLRKKKLTFEDYIAIAGIGLFSTFATLFFLYIAPKIGLSKVQVGNILGSFFTGRTDGIVGRWGGRIAVISAGCICSYLYATIFFARFKTSAFLQGLTFGLILFVAAVLVVFPLLSFFPGVQLSNLSVPAFFGPLQGSFEDIMTFLAATLLFGAILSGVYNQWEEA